MPGPTPSYRPDFPPDFLDRASVVQRKVLTPNEFASLDEVEERLRLYEELTNGEPRPFQWKFDRSKLAAFLQRLEAKRAATEVA